MIRFSEIPRFSLTGKLLRSLLGLLPETLVLPVLQGPGRGVRWVVGSGPHGYWLGSYEADLQRAIADDLTTGGAFWDVGANVGFFTMIGAKRVGANGHVVAVEPEPKNLAALRFHSTLNGFEGRITVCDSAAGEMDGSAMFDRSSGRCTGRLADEGSLKVRVIRLDSLIADGLKPPKVVKIDVEGAEMAVLRGSQNLLETTRPKLFISTHGRDEADQCKDFLFAKGFTIDSLLGLKGPVENIMVAEFV